MLLNYPVWRNRPGRAPKPPFVEKGTVLKKIDVALSYKIVRLFSEGLYQSANKAFEELVTNSFDAGARNVQVYLPPDFTSDGARIIVVDDGEGMDVTGLESLWQVGVSHKRDVEPANKDRKPIGRFGIGKLSTYVLANQLTHICRKNREYFAVTMDYTRLDYVADEGVVPSKPVTLDVRKLSLAEAKEAIAEWTAIPSFNKWGVNLFGRKSTSWTFAIMSNLKPKANELKQGRLRWILETALPLRDDFAIWLNGNPIKPARMTKGRINRWKLGKEIVELSRPAPDDISVSIDESVPATSGSHFGLSQPGLGRVTGYAEAFNSVITTGKSEELSRSHGFFVYVRGRLINLDDPYFGVDSNKLAHGTFSRMRAVVHIDALDGTLQSDREGVSDGPMRQATQNFLQGIFNFVRQMIKVSDEKDTPGSRISRRIDNSPASLTHWPIVHLATDALAGKVTPLYTRVPEGIDDADTFVDSLKARALQDEKFVADVLFSNDLSPDDGIAIYDAATGFLQINALHPFVAAFSSDFLSPKQSLPLQLFSMAEVLLEAQLYQLEIEADDIDSILSDRDELLRFLAKDSGRRTALTISRALQDSRNDQDQLEVELVACLNSLGFSATRIGKSDNADGIALANLSADTRGRPQRYAVSLEAKSTQTDGKKVAAKTVGISTITRQRRKHDCDHALVVGPAFPTTKGELSALAREIEDDREKNPGKTITLVTIDQLARLVRLAPRKSVKPSELREFFQNCSLPQDSEEWINKIASRTQNKEPYKEILEAIWNEQRDEDSVVVKYAALRAVLKNGKAKIRKSDTELRDICRAMVLMAPAYIVARNDYVELEVPPQKILTAIEAAIHEYPEDEIDD